MNIDRLECFLSNKLNTRRLTSRTIPVLPLVVPPSSSPVHLNRLERLDRLADEQSYIEFMNLTKNEAHMKKHISSVLDTDQGERIKNKLKCASRHLMIEYSCILQEYEMSLVSHPHEHDQTLVNQSDRFPAPLQATTPFQQVSQWKCLTPCPKDHLEEVNEIYWEQVYEVPQDGVICSPSVSPVLPHFPRVPTRIVGHVTFNMQRQCNEFVDSSGTELIYHLLYIMKTNKCCFFIDTSELKSASLSTFPFKAKFVVCKDRHIHIPKPNVEISDDEIPSREPGILAATTNTRGVCKCKDRALAKKSYQYNKRDFKPLDRRGGDFDEDSDALGSSLPVVKIAGEFEERLDSLQRLYVWEASRFQR